MSYPRSTFTTRQATMADMAPKNISSDTVATCTTTSSRATRPWADPPAPVALSLSTAVISVFTARRLAITPSTTTARVAKAPAPTSTERSKPQVHQNARFPSSRVVAQPLTASSSHTANPVASAPPSPQRMSTSHRLCITSRPRGAPRASRTAVSRARSLARARSRLVTLMQASRRIRVASRLSTVKARGASSPIWASG